MVGSPFWGAGRVEFFFLFSLSSLVCKGFDPINGEIGGVRIYVGCARYVGSYTVLFLMATSKKVSRVGP